MADASEMQVSCRGFRLRSGWRCKSHDRPYLHQSADATKLQGFWVGWQLIVSSKGSNCHWFCQATAFWSCSAFHHGNPDENAIASPMALICTTGTSWFTLGCKLPSIYHASRFVVWCLPKGIYLYTAVQVVSQSPRAFPFVLPFHILPHILELGTTYPVLGEIEGDDKYADAMSKVLQGYPLCYLFQSSGKTSLKL
ncbi:uncharacterized protein BCR38DRAFT_89488 [Pseudomassariella vexata]|uniref:Uncharacterized protein n=1 Tax=Pseudomassariella vexata TaxID=1141098 RepID=A0A1Y2EDJ3_9PEZI|nr:uncharacterized protein BCR38DRAFT_89488 [Pseudomassariella vexata]ORY69630.1 hypothetical protein BCR38DRAFT_89488 [Pseudomassariella vexata]